MSVYYRQLNKKVMLDTKHHYETNPELISAVQIAMIRAREESSVLRSTKTHCPR